MALTYGLCLGPSSAKDSAMNLCAAITQLTGDGVCSEGSRFEPVADSMALILGSGFGLAAGHWVENDSPLGLEVSPGWPHSDRQDIVAMQTDKKERTVNLTVLENADLNHLPTSPYSVPLFLVKVKRGATNLLDGDVTDMRQYIPKLSEMGPEGLRAYEFTRGGIDQEVERVLAFGQRVINEAKQAVNSMSRYIEQSGVGPGIGEFTTGRLSPGAGWLLCNGGYIPSQYRELKALLGSYLPNITHEDERYSTWVYGGTQGND